MGGGKIIDLHNISEFNSKVAESSSKPKVVKATATWCGPCRVIAPIYEKLSNSHDNVEFYEFDVDNVPDIGQELGVTAMPTFIFFDKDGNKASDLTLRGANPEALEQAIGRVASL